MGAFLSPYVLSTSTPILHIGIVMMAVTVVNVVEDVPGFLTAELPDGLVEKAAHDARSSLVDMVKTAGLDADVQIRGGRPHHAVVTLANELDADLILIASHEPGLQDYFIGSTAAGVVSRAKCSVLVVNSTIALQEGISELNVALFDQIDATLILVS